MVQAVQTNHGSLLCAESKNTVVSPSISSKAHYSTESLKVCGEALIFCSL